MNPDSGKLYTEDEVQAMTEEERSKLKYISRREYSLLQDVEEGARRRTLDKMRNAELDKAKKKRKAQKAARKKNR